MSTNALPSISKDSPVKSKKREKKSQASAAALERFKVVVRRLPPDLPEEIFWQSVAPWVNDDHISWQVFYPGKARKRMSNKENVPSRAYIAFKDQEHLSAFGKAYDGHVFQDKAGNVAIAVVEFAQYQKIPPEKKKADQRMNTIEEDPDYVSFLASLQANSVKRTEADTLEAFLAAQSAADTAPTTTPLLEALKAEKAAQKEKASIIRNHAHYKDMGSVTTIISGKGRSTQSQAQADSSKDSKKDKKKKDTGKKDVPPSTSTPTTPEKKKKGKGSTQAPPVPSNAAGSSKPTPSTASNSAKPVPAQNKANRKRQGQEAPSIAKEPSKDNSSDPAIAIAAAPIVASAGATKVASGSSEVSGPSSGAPVSAAPPARRGRAMLGLSSRQFEAALGGAGLRTRKPTEGRTAASDTQAAGSSNGTPAVAGGATPGIAQEARIDDAPLPPASNQTSTGRGGGPGRGRGRGGRGRGAPPSG